MKRRILIAALALVLAVGGIAALNVHVARKAVPIEMQVEVSIGDAGAAEGLLVDHRIMLGNNLLWYTDYDPATGESDTDFYVTYRNMQPYYRWQGEKTDNTRLMCSAVDVYDMDDPVVKEMWEESEDGYVSRRVYPIDYYDTYPVYLASWWDQDGLSPYYDEALAFDKLRIPVGKYDFTELSLDFGTDVTGATKVDSIGTRDQYMLNRFTAYCVNSGDRILVTAGFPADVQPQTDWAPEGFGLWDMPVHEVRETVGGGYTVRYLPSTAESRLVYPLDIETQRVALLEQSSDGKQILLVTVEEGRFVLHVLDSADYHLMQRLDIDGAEARESSDTKYYIEYYIDGRSAGFGDFRPVEEDWSGYRINPPQDEQGVTFTCEYREYPTVSMRQGDGFLVLLMDSSRVALLTPDGEGYKGEFVCDAPDYSYVENEDGTQSGRYFLYHDERDEVEYYALWSAIPTADATYAMAYNGRYLAMAAYAEDRDLLVSVFGKDGLQYAAYVRSSITTQLGDGAYSFSPVWKDVSISDANNDAPRPGLIWQN